MGDVRVAPAVRADCPCHGEVQTSRRAFVAALGGARAAGIEEDREQYSPYLGLLAVRADGGRPCARYPDWDSDLIYVTDGNGGGLTVLRYTGPLPTKPPIPGVR